MRPGRDLGWALVGGLVLLALTTVLTGLPRWAEASLACGLALLIAAVLLWTDWRRERRRRREVRPVPPVANVVVDALAQNLKAFRDAQAMLDEDDRKGNGSPD